MYRGDLDRAFELLERSRTAISGWVAMVAVDPRLEPLRGDPRYRELLERMNL